MSAQRPQLASVSPSEPCGVRGLVCLCRFMIALWGQVSIRLSPLLSPFWLFGCPGGEAEALRAPFLLLMTSGSSASVARGQPGSRCRPQGCILPRGQPSAGRASPRSQVAMSAHIWLSQPGAVLLASRGCRLGMLLNILQCPGQPLAPKNDLARCHWC